MTFEHEIFAIQAAAASIPYTDDPIVVRDAINEVASAVGEARLALYPILARTLPVKRISAQPRVQTSLDDLA